MPNSSSNSRKETTGLESPHSSLERNMKPSDFLRQKSSDSLDVKQHGDGRRATMLDEFNKKLKSDNLEAIKKSSSPTSSFGKSTPPPQPPQLGKSPTGSLSKPTATHRVSGSPVLTYQGRDNSGNHVGSKESLSSTPGTVVAGGISERVSYILQT